MHMKCNSMEVDTGVGHTKLQITSFLSESVSPLMAGAPVDLRRRYTIRFASTEPPDCPVHGSIVTCDMSLECPGYLKIG